MPQTDVVRRYLEAGAEFGQMTRSRAESIIRDLVKAGEVQREQTQERIDELVDWSRRNRENVVQLIRREINNQLSAMGIATKSDLAALERKLGGSRRAPAKKAAAAKRAAPAKKAKKAAQASKARKGPDRG
jgi:polyhydroxyalkanoate synthesis regulator phasin